jgi:hypothetical protein
MQTLRSQPPVIPKAAIYRYRILILKVFDDHVEQMVTPTAA